MQGEAMTIALNGGLPRQKLLAARKLDTRRRLPNVKRSTDPALE